MKPKSSETKLIGLTGPIGAGKSLVAGVWSELGAGIVEGDEMGRQVLTNDDNLQKMLRERFGSYVFDDTGQVDRKKLGEMAFDSPNGIEDLTRITFPSLYRLAQEQFRTLSEQHKTIVFDAALIYEWGVEGDFDLIVVVTAPVPDLIKRASSKLNIDPEQTTARLAGQLSPDEKAQRADIIITNDAGIDELKRKAVEVWGEMN
ncbi:MAG: dephospho-CoA kinase [Candidatus Hatepunaea meridiana]|nr:dephospho-CoA kinase [Candidatus Hatepunaea meridiana]